MRNINFNTWIRDEVKDILKVNLVNWLTPNQIELLILETKEYLSECDSPEEVEVEQVVEFIFETSNTLQSSLK
tara:strand:- start:215 stop:433 length:219 start_codon:yes stop_codon:yes gene_type:complete